MSDFMNDEQNVQNSENDETYTYSWVNPKLREESQEEGSEKDTSWRENIASWSAASAGATTENVDQGMNQETGQKPEPDIFDVPNKKRQSKKRKPAEKQPMSTGKKWAMNVAMAVVFGLVAGLVFTGVTKAGNALGKEKGDMQKIEVSSTAPAASQQENTGEIFKEASSDTDLVSVSAGGTVADVAAQCMPSLVTISTISVEEMQSFFGQTQKYEVEGAGTGVIVGQNDTELLIATNNHVIEGATSLSVGFTDETAVAGIVKGADASTDLAVVAVRLSDIPAETMNQIRICEMGNSDDLVLGEQVVAIGNALGYGQSVTSGYISAFNRELNLQDNSGNKFTSSGLIQTDASINSGNSGGALLNMRGQLIGINEAKSSGNSSSASVDNIGFAIPISKAEPILENLMTLVTRDKVTDENASYIGITCADVNEETAQMYNMPTGVCLTSIMEGSPAEQAGLKKGDIITAFDGRDVSDYKSLTNILQYYAAGETVDIVIQRADDGDYTEHVIALTLGHASEMPQSSGNTESQQENQRSQSRGGIWP